MRAQLLSTIFRYRGRDETMRLTRKNARRAALTNQLINPEDHEGEALVKEIRKDFQVMKPI